MLEPFLPLPPGEIMPTSRHPLWVLIFENLLKLCSKIGRTLCSHGTLMVILSSLWGKHIFSSNCILALETTIFQFVFLNVKMLALTRMDGGQWTPASRTLYNLRDTVARSTTQVGEKFHFQSLSLLYNYCRWKALYITTQEKR